MPLCSSAHWRRTLGSTDTNAKHSAYESLPAAGVSCFLLLLLLLMLLPKLPLLLLLLLLLPHRAAQVCRLHAINAGWGQFSPYCLASKLSCIGSSKAGLGWQGCCNWFSWLLPRRRK
jgi:hypothetical protein